MNLTLKNYSLSFLLLLIVFSCNDDEADVSAKTKLLTSKNWLQTKREIGPEGGPYDDITFTIAECDLDNLMRFKTNGKYDDIVGDDLCYDFEVNSIGTWKWEDSENQIHITNSNGITEKYALTEISDAVLKLKVIGQTNAGIEMIFSYRGQ